MTPTSADWIALLPGVFVLGAGLLAVGADVVIGLRDVEGTQRIRTLVMCLLAYVGLGAAGWLLVNRLASGAPAARGFGGSLVLDDMAAFISLAVIVATALIVAISAVDTRRRRTDFGEYYGLLLLAAAGMMYLASANDFVLLFLNLEILSLALYVLTGITRRNPRSNEAAVKYLVTGAFATGFLLMGMAFIYGATGSLNLDVIGRSLENGNSSGLLGAGFALLLAGFAFKIGAAPFHFWVADVYEGAPTSVTAFMSVTVKAASIAALIRVLIVAGESRPELWTELLWGLAVLTMILGNLLALQQQSVKRMLAYSSVAHTGYALVALATLTSPGGRFSADGAGAALFYVFVYTFMTLGAFLVLVWLGQEVRAPNGRSEWQDGEHIEDFAGLAFRHPWVAVAMTVFLVSLGGLPPTAGFFGKFYLFRAAVQQGHAELAIIGVLASLVSLYYYLRVVVYMYMREPVASDEEPEASVGFVVGVTAFATLALGILPSTLIEIASRSVVLGQ